MRRDNLEIPQPPINDRPGDSWMPAVDGAGSDGEARVRTWSGRRRRWTVLFLICVSLGALATLAIVPAEQLFKPGELSTPHAQILAGSVSGEKCGACHHQAAFSLAAWFQSASDSHVTVTQSDLCMDCHHRTINANLALAAHNLPLSVRDQMSETIRLASKRSAAGSSGLMPRLIPDAAVDQNDVACRTCHQEHHGAEADLLSLSTTNVKPVTANASGRSPIRIQIGRVGRMAVAENSRSITPPTSRLISPRGIRGRRRSIARSVIPRDQRVNWFAWQATKPAAKHVTMKR
ncbi:MAG: hypothetical protein F9B45_12300 [Phycisphaera sp. RhM]|nr:hypothetical protein [Phycisphaera sp. RhM]